MFSYIIKIRAEICVICASLMTLLVIQSETIERHETFCNSYFFFIVKTSEIPGIPGSNSTCVSPLFTPPKLKRDHSAEKTKNDERVIFFSQE